ncbi:type VI secretion system contractile sheath small subunit [bacterium]|nr:type VI secretion system contractile sheath small subunit [bacterium]
MARGLNRGTQHKLTRVRPPRVRMTTDVETRDSEEAKELLCNIAVTANLTGKINEEDPIKDYRDRRFEEIDKENFGAIFARCKPRVQMQVPDRISRGPDGKPVAGQSLGVTIDFKTYEDFEPARVAEKVPALQKLLEARKALEAAKTYIGVNGGLERTMRKSMSLLDEMIAARTVSPNAAISGPGSSSSEASATPDDSNQTPPAPEQSDR